MLRFEWHLWSLRLLTVNSMGTLCSWHKFTCFSLKSKILKTVPVLLITAIKNQLRKSWSTKLTYFIFWYNFMVFKDYLHSLILAIISGDLVLPHFMDGETKAHNTEVTTPKSQQNRSGHAKAPWCQGWWLFSDSPSYLILYQVPCEMKSHEWKSFANSKASDIYSYYFITSTKPFT